MGKYEPINLNQFNNNENYLVFSGIGNHQTFVSMIRNYGLNVIKDLEFPDHYQFTQNDINQILVEANNLNCQIITTEKDYYRLSNLKNEKIKYLMSELKIINEEKIISLIIKQ